MKIISATAVNKILTKYLKERAVKVALPRMDEEMIPRSMIDTAIERLQDV